MSSVRQGYARLEQHVIAQAPLGLVHVPDAETQDYDAQLLNSENPVPGDIKTCQEWIDVSGSNGDRRRGRFLFRRHAHDRLVELGGLYFLGVLDDDDQLVHFDVFEAGVVDDRLETGWSAPTKQVNWSRFFPEVVQRG